MKYQSDLSKEINLKMHEAEENKLNKLREKTTSIKMNKYRRIISGTKSILFNQRQEKQLNDIIKKANRLLSNDQQVLFFRSIHYSSLNDNVKSQLKKKLIQIWKNNSLNSKNNKHNNLNNNLNNNSHAKPISKSKTYI